MGQKDTLESCFSRPPNVSNRIVDTHLPTHRGDAGEPLRRNAHVVHQPSIERPHPRLLMFFIGSGAAESCGHRIAIELKRDTEVRKEDLGSDSLPFLLLEPLMRIR